MDGGAGDITGLIADNTVAACVCPRLAHRHRKQGHDAPNSPTLYYAQMHEIHTYSYFRNARLDAVAEISVDGIRGHALSPVDLRSFSLLAAVDEEYFYGVLRHAPVPFMFIPSATLAEVAGLCRGAFSFRDGHREGIMMSLEFAARVGIDFIGAEYLLRREVVVYYIGLLFNHDWDGQ